MKARILVLLACLSLAAAGVWAHGGEEHVIGTVTQVSANSIVVKTTAKAPVTVAVAPATKFIKSKAAVKVTDLSVGDRVVIHAIEGEDEKLTADTVEFGAAPAAKPAPSTAKPAQPGAAKPAPAAAKPAGAAAAQQSKTLTGEISDVMCAGKHPAGMSAAECTRSCAKEGGYALVVGKDVYTLKGHEADLDKYAAQTVTVTGAVNGKTVTVASVMPAKKG
jgi:hypothetical protein